MQIDTPEVFRLINDYDVVFGAGMAIPFSLDFALGDTITETDTKIIVHLVPKPSQSDPEKLMPGEDTTIYLKHVASIQHRIRKVPVLTSEQRLGQQQVWQALRDNGTVQ